MQKQNGANSQPTGSQEQRGQWTEEQRIQAGNLAAEALGNPVVNVVHEMMINKYRGVIESAKQEHKKEILGAKDMIDATREVFLVMASLVGDAQNIVTARHQQNSPEAVENRRLDTQGTGLPFTEQ